MKNNHIMTVFSKEIKDIFRDRRTVMLTFLLPLVLYPVMFLFMGSAVNRMTSSAETNTTIAIDNVPGLWEEALNGKKGLVLVNTSNPEEALKNKEIKVIIRGEQATDGRFNIILIQDEQQSDSSYSASYLAGIISEYNNGVVNQKLSDMGISLDNLTPITYEIKSIQEVSGEEPSGGNMMLSMMVPMLMCIFLAMGSMSTANDLFAGEKERKTMEPLLCTRAGRSSILTGKFIAVTAMGLLSVVSMVGGLLAGYLINPNAMSMGEALGEIKFSISIPMAALLLLLLLIMSMFFAGIHVAISTYARTIKEASTYGTFVMLASYVPVFSTMFMQSGDFSQATAFIPIINVIGSTKMILSGVSNLPYLGISIAVSAVFLFAVLTFTRWLFKKETIMLRSA